ncbi:MAG: hypothetical protein HY813_03560 [Candidatus Portnoybacteria bacterium]|nr:hypothetical protein [Candidatus Portnoybacteria bacterium]
MKPFSSKIFIKAFLPVFSAIILVAGIAYAVWTEPTAIPPGDNVDAPINIGTTSQYKSGALGIGGALRGYSNAIFDGNVGIGTTTPTSPAPNGQGNNVDVNDVYIRSIGKWASELSGAGGSGLRKFVGPTPNSYNGAGVGGYAGGDAKCAVAYPGSRMCMSADFVSIKPTAIGWYNNFASWYYYNPVTSGYIGTDCRGWTSSASSAGGNWWYYDSSSGTSYPYLYPCDTSRPLLCCG